ncbi:hypothetical protein AWB99_08690 [Mycolicibacterium confluentis]|uniref:Uncharacterized protein n=2 Tax=Mycolicibacterium confluentis TaxID=28047 RepID=A0A7I7XVG9_9MYCO|nr:hypothetical protein AWB99_08690 [Mycolicibacterium confluentis]BBZ33285.1 hypothetical protein MCNF_18900 [Mycolicibacterium confluentis]
MDGQYPSGADAVMPQTLIVVSIVAALLGCVTLGKAAATQRTGLVLAATALAMCLLLFYGPAAVFLCVVAFG